MLNQKCLPPKILCIKNDPGQFSYMQMYLENKTLSQLKLSIIILSVWVTNDKLESWNDKGQRASPRSFLRAFEVSLFLPGVEAEPFNRSPTPSCEAFLFRTKLRSCCVLIA